MTVSEAKARTMRNACKEGADYLRTRSLHRAWAECNRPDWLNWYVWTMTNDLGGYPVGIAKHVVMQKLYQIRYRVAKQAGLSCFLLPLLGGRKLRLSPAERVRWARMIRRAVGLRSTGRPYLRKR